MRAEGERIHLIQRSKFAKSVHIMYKKSLKMMLCTILDTSKCGLGQNPFGNPPVGIIFSKADIVSILYNRKLEVP